MVGPSLTDDERTVASRRLKLGFVALVGFSGALIAVQGGGSTTSIAAGFVGGLGVGVVLLWFLLRWWAEFLPSPGNGR
ncbi:hypothetical protein [Halobellus captivus]|uniref:hypothetical protein n=1 Tax=Halobellus captivus TaxID=2592614 RepID=UPI0011A1ECB3|nr:hypothetical protein [Halobellus captivus]